MKTIKKEEVVKCIHEILGNDYDVSSCGADVTILVEIVPSFAGFSVVKDYEKMQEFSIRQLCQDVVNDTFS